VLAVAATAEDNLATAAGVAQTSWIVYLSASSEKMQEGTSFVDQVLLPPFQIISHSKNLGKSKHLKFDQIYMIRCLVRLVTFPVGLG
jgi:hypothetical protein